MAKILPELGNLFSRTLFACSYIFASLVLEGIEELDVEELSLKNTCFCKTLSYKDNYLHVIVSLGFKFSLQTMVSTLNRN